MAIQIPGQGKRFSLPLNYSDVLGNIYSSFNVDFTSNVGKLRLGPRLLLNTAVADQANLGLPVAFTFFNDGNDKIWAVAGTRVFSNSGTVSSAFTEVGGGAPTTCAAGVSDMKVFNNSMYITTNSNSVYKRTSGGAWSSFTAGSASTQPHLLCQYSDRMYMTTRYVEVISWNTSDTVSTVGSSNAVAVPAGNTGGGQIITCIQSGSNRIWIGVLNLAGGKGSVYEWDGSATQVTKGYKLESAGPVAMVIKDDVPWIMDTNGALCVWNGGYFKEVARLNINRKLLKGAYLSTNLRYIHPNGMTVVNGKINILINNEILDSTGSIEEFCPSGVYEYDPDIGLYHKGSVSYLTAAGTVSDYSQIRISQPGAISELRPPLSTDPGNGITLIGCTYFTDATTTTHGIFYDDTNDTKAKCGYVVTPKIYSSSIQDAWQRMWINYRKLLNSSDRIIVKYRTSEASPTEFTGTWTSTTTFTASSSDVTPVAGNEIEIVSGKGGGASAHISSVSLNAGTYTVTLDTAIGASSGTAKMRQQAWTKLYTVSDQNTTEKGATVGEKSSWIQFKIVMFFTGKDELEQIAIANAQHQPIT